MLAILDSCDHWLYYDCPIDVLAENFTITNHLEPELSSFKTITREAEEQLYTNLQVVEFQAGLMVRN